MKTRRIPPLSLATTGWPWRRPDRPRRQVGNDLIDRTPLGLLQRRVTDRLSAHRDEAGFFTLTQFSAIALGTAMVVTLLAFVGHAYFGSSHTVARSVAYSGSTNYINQVESDVANASQVLVAEPDLLVLDRQTKDDSGQISHTLVEYALDKEPAPAGSYPTGAAVPAGYVFGVRRSVCGPDCSIDTTAGDDGVTSTVNAAKTTSKWVASDLALNATGQPDPLFTYGDGKTTLAAYTTASDQHAYAASVKVVYPHYAAYTSTKPVSPDESLAALNATPGAIQTADGAQAVSTGQNVTDGGPLSGGTTIFHIFDTFKYLGDDATEAGAGTTLGIPEVRTGVPNASWIDMNSSAGASKGWSRHSAGDGHTTNGTFAAAVPTATNKTPTAVVDTGTSDYTIEVAPEQYPGNTTVVPADGEAAYARYVDPDNWTRVRLVDTRTSSTYVSGGTASAQTVAWQAKTGKWYFTALRDSWYKTYSDGKKCFFNPQSAHYGGWVSKANADGAPGLIVGGADEYRKDIESGCEGVGGELSDLINGSALELCYPECAFRAANPTAAQAKANTWANNLNDPYKAGSVKAAYGFPTIGADDVLGYNVGAAPTCRPKTGNCLDVAQGDSASNTNCTDASDGCATPPYDSYSSGGHYHLPPGRGGINPDDTIITTQTTTNQVTNTTNPSANCPTPTAMYGPCTLSLTYTTVYNDSWSMITEKDVAGVITRVATTNLGSAPPVAFGFVTSGKTIYADTWDGQGKATARALITDTRTTSATFAGIGYAGGNSPDYASIDSVDISNGQ